MVHIQGGMFQAVSHSLSYLPESYGAESRETLKGSLQDLVLRRFFKKFTLPAIMAA